jgi:hypothetical protein
MVGTASAKANNSVVSFTKVFNFKGRERPQEGLGLST